MKRMGIEGIYLGGWATSAKGSITEDPGPDLASYPLSQVPDEAAVLVRALLTADRNQQYLRLRMTERAARRDPGLRLPPVHHRRRRHRPRRRSARAQPDPPLRRGRRARLPHRGPAPGHQEVRPPGRQGSGPSDEQIKRLNAARFQLDIMRVPGIIVARTDAEAANLIDSRADERDQPFLLGATNLNMPSYKACFLALMRRFYELGVKEINGHLLYALPTGSTPPPTPGWSARASWAWSPTPSTPGGRTGSQSIDDLFDKVESRFVTPGRTTPG